MQPSYINVFVFFFFLLILPSLGYQDFRHRRVRTPLNKKLIGEYLPRNTFGRPKNNFFFNAIPESLSKLGSPIRNLKTGKSKSEYLVGIGDKFALYHKDHPLLDAPETRVSGCISVVHLFTELDDDHLSIKNMYGKADSRLIQGIVSLLCEGLKGMDIKKVLNLDPLLLLKDLGIESISSAGRNNGLINMITLIQNQIIDEISNNTTTNNNTTSTNNYIKKKDELSDYERLVNMPSQADVAVLLSGGVDSSVALKLLIDQGYRPRAFYLRIWLEDEVAHLGTCPWEEDLDYASKVCKQFDVPLEAIPMQQEYTEKVVKYTVSEAKAGRTPNPDVMCNSRIKFGSFYDKVAKDFKYIASGHYAQTLESPSGTVRLLRSVDRIKDQTYFLSNLKQEKLKKLLFPIGHLTKGEVRNYAKDFNLPNKFRKDSQGICFLGKLHYNDFLKTHLGVNSGEIRCATSKMLLGEHNGLWFHTIGQRKGIGPLVKQYSHLGPWYVASKDINTNTLYISNKYNLFENSDQRISMSVRNINWISGYAPSNTYPTQMDIQIRHGPTSQKGDIIIYGAQEDEHDNTRAEIKLHTKDSIAAGQYAAFYANNEECLGAGMIML